MGLLVRTGVQYLVRAFFFYHDCVGKKGIKRAESAIKRPIVKQWAGLCRSQYVNCG